MTVLFGIILKLKEEEYESGKRNTYMLGKPRQGGLKAFPSHPSILWTHLLFILTADSGYGQQPWLLVPFKQPLTVAQEAYNKAHRIARHRVERCIGVLKARFRCLCKQRIPMYSPATAGRIINACAILHNILLDANYPMPTEAEIAEQADTDDEEEEEGILDEYHVLADGNRIRDQIVQQYFT